MVLQPALRQREDLRAGPGGPAFRGVRPPVRIDRLDQFVEAVALGRIAAPGFFESALHRWAYTRAAWRGDSPGSINPKDEVAAFTAAIDARLVSRERAEWELFGTDWRTTYPTKLAEHKRMAADGLLPTPKAGAAAPQSSSTGAPA